MSDQIDQLLGRLERLSGDHKPHIITNLLREQGKHIEADYIEGLSDELRLCREEIARLNRKQNRRTNRRKKR